MNRTQNSAGRVVLRLSSLLLLLLLTLIPIGADLMRPAYAQSVPPEPIPPAQEPEPVTRAAVEMPILPEPEPEPEPPTPPTPPEGPVDNDYFADAVFLGDSRTEALDIYSDLHTPTYLYFVGATVDSVQTKRLKEEGSTEAAKTLMEQLDELEFTKLYIMLGINELGWPEENLFYDRYDALLTHIRETHPDVRIALESILPVSARQDRKKTYVNNTRINEYNEDISALAEKHGCTYLDVASVVRDEEGCLQAKLTQDGIHPGGAGCRAWAQYLKDHPI